MVRCEICGQEFRTPSSLGTHKSYKHDTSTEVCLICNQDIKKTVIWSHIKKEHGLSYQEYLESTGLVDTSDFIACQICGTKMKLLTWHIKSHGMTNEQYQELYPGSPVVSSNFKSIMSERNKSEKMRSITAEHNKTDKMRKLTVERNKDSEFQKICIAGMRTPEEHERRSRLMTEYNLKKWQDDEYAHKMLDYLGRQSSNKYGKKQTYISYHFDKSYNVKSGCEAQFIRVCEVLDCKTLEYEPLKIPYTLDGIEHSYYPDFLVDNKYLVEVKSDDNYDDSDMNKAKSEAAIKYCEDHGLVFCWYRRHYDSKITNLDEIVLCHTKIE